MHITVQTSIPSDEIETDLSVVTGPNGQTLAYDGPCEIGYVSHGPGPGFLPLLCAPCAARNMAAGWVVGWFLATDDDPFLCAFCLRLFGNGAPA